MTELASHLRRRHDARGSGSVPAMWLSLGAGVVLFAALVLGGAGSGYPIIGAIVEALSVALIVQLGATGNLFRVRREMMLPWAISILVLLLPLVQLFPMPPGLWLNLPGHRLPAQILSAAAIPLGARPLSLDPALTEMTILELLPGLALFWVALHIREREQLGLLCISVGVAIASALLGAAQKAAGGELILFATAHSQNAPGFFVNRNHQACFLLAAMPQLAAIIRLAPAMRRLRTLERSTIFLSLLALLAAAAIATTSRMGLLMLIPSLAVALAIGFGAKRLSAYLFGAFAFAVAAAAVAAQSSAFAVAFARLGADEDDRTLFWAATREAIAHFWPMGSGLGTFTRVYPTVEKLDTLSKNFPYNAHDDYLELLLEGGAASLVLLVGAGLFLILTITRLARQGRPEASVAGLAAASSIIIILFHSIVDYPLRMMSMMAMFGLLAGILATPSVTTSVLGIASAQNVVPNRRSSGRRRRGALLTTILIAPCALFVWYRIAALAGAQAAYTANDIPRAFALDPRWSDATATLALQRLNEKRLVAARTLAERATADSPLDPEGPAALILINQAEKKAAADRILDMLPQLGWRHSPSQYLLVFRASERGDLAAAIPHIDALLRQDLYRDQFYPFLRAGTAYPDGLVPLARRLALNPKWRADYLLNLGDLKPEAFDGHEALLTLLKHSKAPPTDSEENSYLRRVARDGDYARAAAASDRLFGRDRGGNEIRDASFVRFGQAAPSPGPFDWQSIDTAGTMLTATGDGLRIMVEGRAQATILRQILVAPPGRYSLMWRVQPHATRDVGWAVKCIAGSYLKLDPHSPGPTLEREVTIPSTGCSIQQLELQLDHRSIEPADVTIDSIRLVRAPPE